MNEILAKYIAGILTALDINISNKTLVTFTSMIINVINDFMLTLKRVMQQQRRIHPALLDTKIAMKMYAIDSYELALQLDLSKAMQKGPLGSYFQRLNEQSSQLFQRLEAMKHVQGEEELDEDELNKKDKDYKEAFKLIPPTHKRKFYIQNYVPDFPADHTYKYSPIYTQKIEDPKELRQILVNEGNSALKSLLSLQQQQDAQKMMISPPDTPEDYKEAIKDEVENTEMSAVKTNDEKDTKDSVGMEKKPEETGLEKSAETPIKMVKTDEKININLPTKPLDVEAYAKKRLFMIERKKRRRNEQIDNLKSNKEILEYITLTKHLNSYKSSPIVAQLVGVENGESELQDFPITDQVKKDVSRMMSKEYDLLMRSIKIQKKQKQERYAKRLKLERERQAQLKEMEHDDENENEFDFDNLEFGFDEDNMNVAFDEGNNENMEQNINSAFDEKSDENNEHSKLDNGEQNEIMKVEKQGEDADEEVLHTEEIAFDGMGDAGMVTDEELELELGGDTGPTLERAQSEPVEKDFGSDDEEDLDALLEGV